MCFGLQGLLLVGWFAFGIPRVSGFFEGLERHRLHWGPDRGACLELQCSALTRAKVSSWACQADFCFFLFDGLAVSPVAGARVHC